MMSLRHALLLFFALAAFMTAPKALISQSEGYGQIAERKNNIAFEISLRNHFDGAPFIQTSHVGYNAWLGMGKGISYTRRLGPKSMLSASATGHYTRYYVGPSYPEKVGDIMERSGFIFELLYHLKLASVKDWSFWCVVGPNFRTGKEFALNYIFYYEVHVEWYTLRDPGLTAGFVVRKPLFWRLEFNSMVKFTQYFFRYDDGSNHWIQFPNRSTRNMLTMQAGLGFKF